MNGKKLISILFPRGEEVSYRVMSETAAHDLGLDTVTEKLAVKESERNMILSVMRTMTADPETARYRIGVFSDICAFPEMRERILELLGQVQFLNEYGSFKRDHEIKSGLWEFLHRLSELDDYIKCVEALRECLETYEIRSDGLLELKQYIDAVYDASLFEELKKDVAALRADTHSLRSVTLGINLNQSFEVESVGLISVNSKPFVSSGILGNFAGRMGTKDGITEGNEWNGSYRFQNISPSSGEFLGKVGRYGEFFAAMRLPVLGPLMAAGTIARIPEQDSGAYMTHYFDREVSHLLSHLTRKLEQLLSKYVSLSIGDITDLIPEFVYYVRWAEYIEGLKEKGLSFCTPELLTDAADVRMQARGLYNLKLAVAGELDPEEIVKNDLDFSDEHTVYLLTGANRGGKTTITQGVGLLYVLAQGGLSVPAQSFAFTPADCIYTHYPADEDKTLDLGRLGEECRRFQEIFETCTGDSLLLLNETFSTTSFEEGYYIAKDAVRAILDKRIRTIYNTHMHKLAYEIGEFNAATKGGKAASLVAESKEGRRSFLMKIAPPEGRSYAEDIARKYGVTYEQLTGTGENIDTGKEEDADGVLGSV
ncbi:MAG: DNA mismatch repair protein [Lachnospiraceae bacterium]|nr:DNA mismatch repair protein [Lachnospiraceae bacterium]